MWYQSLGALRAHNLDMWYRADDSIATSIGEKAILSERMCERRSCVARFGGRLVLVIMSNSRETHAQAGWTYVKDSLEEGILSVGKM